MDPTLGSEAHQLWQIRLVVYPEDQIMSETERSQDIPLTTEPAGEAPDVGSPPESLDKVRDILFGGQMRAIEARIQELDDRFRQEQDWMFARFERPLAELQSTIRQEIESLDERFSADRAQHAIQLEALGSELREAIRNLSSRQHRLEEAVAEASAGLHDMLLEHQAAMNTEIERLSQRLASELQPEIDRLRTDKLDVAAIADVFSDMVGRLSGDSRASAVNGPQG